jgi:RecJ-like exonuclease
MICGRCKGAGKVSNPARWSHMACPDCGGSGRVAVWQIAVEGASKVTLLKRAGTPVARFYAGRFDQVLVERIAQALNEAQV